LVCLCCLSTGELRGADVQAFLDAKIAAMEAGKGATGEEFREIRKGIQLFIDTRVTLYSDYLKDWPQQEQVRYLLLLTRMSAVDPDGAHAHFKRFPTIAATLAALRNDHAATNTPIGQYALAVGEFINCRYARNMAPPVNAYRQLAAANPFLADCLLRFVRYYPFDWGVASSFLNCVAQSPLPLPAKTGVTNPPTASGNVSIASQPPVNVFVATVPLSIATNRLGAAEIVVLNLMGEQGSIQSAYESYLWGVTSLGAPASNCGQHRPPREIRIYSVVCKGDDQDRARAFCQGLVKSGYDGSLPTVCVFFRNEIVAMLFGDGDFRICNAMLFWVVESRLRDPPAPPP